MLKTSSDEGENEGLTRGRGRDEDVEDDFTLHSNTIQYLEVCIYIGWEKNGRGRGRRGLMLRMILWWWWWW